MSTPPLDILLLACYSFLMDFVVRDVIGVGGGGVRIRFRADNPGPWFLLVSQNSCPFCSS